eukprot:3594509-Prorocentrum_lima.AAC.1
MEFATQTYVAAEACQGVEGPATEKQNHEHAWSKVRQTIVKRVVGEKFNLPSGTGTAEQLFWMKRGARWTSDNDVSFWEAVRCLGQNVSASWSQVDEVLTARTTNLQTFAVLGMCPSTLQAPPLSFHTHTHTHHPTGASTQGILWTNLHTTQEP